MDGSVRHRTLTPSRRRSTPHPLVLCGLVAAGVGAATPARATPTCDGAPTVDEVAQALAATIRASLPEAGAIDTAVASLGVAIDCLDTAVDDAVWAQILLDLTIARFHLDRDWRATRLAAAWARPDLPLQVGPTMVELATWEPVPPRDPRTLPFGREVWLDGRRRTDLPALEGLHVLQGTRCDVWRSTLVEGAEAADERTVWFTPCPAPPWTVRDTALVVTGGVATALGVAAAATSYAIATGTTDDPVPDLGGAPLTPDVRTTLRATNATGWAVASAGVSMAISGAILRSMQVRRARARP